MREIQEASTIKELQKNSRKGRNPQTGEDLILEGRRVVTFKPSGILRTKVNETK
jgi:integration host factor subunit alpha